MSDKEPEVKLSTKMYEDGEVEEKSKYDQIWSTQQAINMAVAENRVVRFLTNKTNKEIMAKVDDKKGCLFRKPDRDSMEVAVIPPGIEDFSFDQIDTGIATATIRPKKSGLIWTP